MLNLKLKAIKFNTDFRKTELTNYDEFKKSKSFPGTLQENETYLFVSRSGNQLVWIFNVKNIKNATGHSVRMIDSRRWRIDGSSCWNPYMLQNYANAVDINLDGFRRFEETFFELRKKNDTKI